MQTVKVLNKGQIVILPDQKEISDTNRRRDTDFRVWRPDLSYSAIGKSREQRTGVPPNIPSSSEELLKDRGWDAHDVNG